MRLGGHGQTPEHWPNHLLEVGMACRCYHWRHWSKRLSAVGMVYHCCHSGLLVLESESFKSIDCKAYEPLIYWIGWNMDGMRMTTKLAAPLNHTLVRIYCHYEKMRCKPYRRNSFHDRFLSYWLIWWRRVIEWIKEYVADWNRKRFDLWARNPCYILPKPVRLTVAQMISFIFLLHWHFSPVSSHLATYRPRSLWFVRFTVRTFQWWTPQNQQLLVVATIHHPNSRQALGPILPAAASTCHPNFQQVVWPMLWCLTMTTESHSCCSFLLLHP